MCYRFELLEFEDCLFENVDATYILHLEGNGRIDHIYEQLEKYHPTNKVYIVYNKGYTCEKGLKMKTVGNDIVHSNIKIFEHAKQYKHILVLEDDFIFSEELSKHSKNVDTFLKRDTSFVYQLGSMPFITIPIDMYHYRIIGLLGHSNIYSTLSRKKLIDNYEKDKITGLKGFDDYLLQVKVIPIYMYYKPLCYQTFPMTDSRKGWFEYEGVLSYISYFLELMINSFISLSNLENNPEPGFSILYFISKMFTLFLFFMILWLVSKNKIFQKLNKYIKQPHKK